MKIIGIDELPFHELRYVSSGRRGKVQACVLPFQCVWVDKLPDGVSAIVVTSDLQGREKGGANRLLGEVVCEELELLCDMGEIPAVNGLVLAGDLYDYPECHKRGGTGDVTSVWNAFASAFPSVVGVHGNHDTVDEAALNADVTVLDGNITECMGLNIGGVSGIIGREDRNQRKSEADFSKVLRQVLKKSPDMVVLHQGPDEPVSGRIGDPLVRELLEEQGSSIVAFGHCPWDDPYTEVGEHQLLNVDGRVMLLLQRE